MDIEYAKYLLEKTRQDYNRIAGHFAKTREWVWEDVVFLGQDVWAGENILDLGCGNGRLLELFRDRKINYFGVDSSEKLIEIAKARYPEKEFLPSAGGRRVPEAKGVHKFQVADALNLPFPDNFFHKVFCIAVLHHIPSNKLRLQFLEEARRVLRQEGRIILTVWNLWQRKTVWKILLKYALLKLLGRSKLDFGDLFLPWKSPEGEVLANRYFHCFTKEELKSLAKKAGFKIKAAWIGPKNGEKNIYLIAEK